MEAYRSRLGLCDGLEDLFSLIFFIICIGDISILNFPFSSVMPPEIRIESVVSIDIVANDRFSDVSLSTSLPLTLMLDCWKLEDDDLDQFDLSCDWVEEQVNTNIESIYNFFMVGF